MAMAPSKDGTPVVLAVEILAITVGSNQQPGLATGLPTTTVARVIAWSHGQSSAETSALSERGKVSPVLLPIGEANVDCVVGRKGDASIELEVSLWDLRQTEVAGELSRVMLDLGAEVTLPAPGKLGKSKHQATER